MKSDELDCEQFIRLRCTFFSISECVLIVEQLVLALRREHLRLEEPKHVRFMAVCTSER